ncbi:hypothetical protein ACFO1B_54060 [Dactylosporangium siamense]|uniref:Uncharacterized protein n=1 Tax=Dactylosporangium siamense TaxID=685454 RepID=A0A919PM81_9ACTN|nr:hypothetical protein [Dactylosporangium siamense]GIG46717.1 hypothetical protein Dsi01nite_047580 [Dactylosporangium siamense]
MNTYDGQVNDYLRAVEQALVGVPAGRRDELLADLSDHIAAKLAETRTEHGPAAHASGPEAHSILDLFGDPAELAAELSAAERSAAAAPIEIEIDPGRKAGALLWVLITIAMVSLLCVGVVLAGVFVFFTGR